MTDSNEWGGIGDDDENEEEEGEYEFISGRDSLILLVDCSEEMFVKTDDSTPFELTMRCAKSIMTNKIISSDKDLVGIVFFGTETSENPLEFKHITVFQELKEPGAEKIIEILHILDNSQKFSKKYGHNKKFSLSDVLWACSSMFSKTDIKVASKRILLFTNNDNPHANDNQLRLQAQRKAADIADTGISLDLMHIKPANGETFNVDSFYRELIHLPDDEEYAATMPDASEKFEELLTRIRSKHMRKRRQGAITLTLSDGLSLGVGVYTLARQMRIPFAVTLHKEQNENLKVVRKTYCQSTGEIIFPAEIHKYVTYSGKDIVFDKEEVNDFKKFFDPGLVLLGFKPRSYLKLKHFVCPSSFIYPDEDSVIGSTSLFAALLTKCAEKDVIAICRYTARRNTSPCLVALVPQEEELDENNIQLTPPGFHVIKLPFSDDIRKLEISNKLRADKEQIELSSKIVKKLQFKYDPDAFENPVLQTHWRNIEALALDLDNCEEIVDYTKPNEELIKKRVGPLLEEFRNSVYPPGYNPGSAGGKKREAAASSRESTSKRAKVKTETDDDDMEINVEEIALKKELNTLTLEVLKKFCKRAKIKITGKKKADLISEIYEFYKLDPE